MTNPSREPSNEFELPYVDLSVINELAASQDKHFSQEEWHELSETNPYLRDLITRRSQKIEPEDLGKREEVIIFAMELLEAVERAHVIRELGKKLLEVGIEADSNKAERILFDLEAAAAESPEPIADTEQSITPTIHCRTEKHTSFFRKLFRHTPHPPAA